MKTTSVLGQIEFRQLSLKDIFPCNERAVEEYDDTSRVNHAYRQLFQDLIPGFSEHVQFVLAEVLEIDRIKSLSRLLVYSGFDDNETKDLIEEYKRILNSLKAISPTLISESSAFYLTSKIWCAETRGLPRSPESSQQREWRFPGIENISRTRADVKTQTDIAAEESNIERIFETYVSELYSSHLRHYPFSYVLLVPIVLTSILGHNDCKKLGAVFLHFATTQQLEDIDLRRIYGRTILFWHYYFTSEAIELRQRKLEEHEARAGMLNKIEPYLDAIRKGLGEIHHPLRRLEAELSPVKGIVFGGKVSSDFFSAGGRPVSLRDDLPEIWPRHDWVDGNVEAYKLIVAGILIRVLNLEGEIPGDKDLWKSLSEIVSNSRQAVVRELLKSFDDLTTVSPTDEQVKRTYGKIKVWFNDSYKREAAAGLPLEMLELACRVWKTEVVIEQNEMPCFWVASRPAVDTIDALEMLNAVYRIQRATIAVTKTRNPISNAPLSCCELKLRLAPPVQHRGSLRDLSRSLSKAIGDKETPRGDMTKFLWIIGGQRNLSLRGTNFIWQQRQSNEDISIAFTDKVGPPQSLSITWRGRVEV